MGKFSATRLRTWSFVLCALCFVLLAIVTQSVQSYADVQSTKYIALSTNRPVYAATHDDSSLVSTATLEGRLAVFDEVWETIQERYYDPTYNGIDWEAKRDMFRPSAAKASSANELYDVLRQMIASLKDAHTRVYSPDEKFDWWSPRYVTVGLTVREIEGVPLVVQVDPNSAAARTGIRPGDALISIDGLSVQQFISDRLKSFGPRANGSTRYRTVATLFEGQAGTSVTVTWSTREGKWKSAVLPRYWTERQLGFNNQRKGDIAILRIDAFTQSVAVDFSKALPKVLEDAAAIVLDLRSNGGGDAEAMADVASLFLDDGINLGKFADRSGASFELQTYSKRLWRVPQLGRVKLPLVVLTSESTSSAAEIMVAALQMKGRARVIGTVTCGCVLAIRNRHPLPDGGLLDVSEFDYRTANGVRLEGAGIKPDNVVTLTRNDIYSRRDAALEYAKNVLRNR
ncbi:MAG TPA: S41 family peptidase [Pyrinomonadaceae bacterium]|nr:S41 family peptidase [Pyrinomonadaceae bacterium]